MKTIAEKLNVEESAIFKCLPHLDTDDFQLPEPTPLKSDENLAKYIDHTLLKPNASAASILQICKEAKEHQFATVCVNPCNIELVRDEVQGTNVGVAVVIGFPLGQNKTETKAQEAKDAFASGATEVDMVMNYARLLDGDYKYVFEDVKRVVEASNKDSVKVIIETSQLKENDVIAASVITVLAGAWYVKTSTGFTGDGAQLETCALMKAVIGDKAKLKASGGIRTREQAIKFIEIGAERIGTSGGIDIVKGLGDAKAQGY